MRDHQWVDIPRLPPLRLLSDLVKVVVVDCTEGNGEFVANFEAKSSRLSEANMVRVRRGPPADDARLRGYEAEVLLATNSFRLTDREHALISLRRTAFSLNSAMRPISRALNEGDSARSEVFDELRYDVVSVI